LGSPLRKTFQESDPQTDETASSRGGGKSDVGRPADESTAIQADGVTAKEAESASERALEGNQGALRLGHHRKASSVYTSIDEMVAFDSGSEALVEPGVGRTAPLVKELLQDVAEAPQKADEAADPEATHGESPETAGVSRSSNEIGSAMISVA